MAEKSGRIRLEAGIDQLEEWSAGAGQAERNAVYEALFAVSDGSVFWAYLTFDDVHGAGEFFVLVREDLVVKINFPAVDAFGITYIGAPHEAPGYDLGIDRAS